MRSVYRYPLQLVDEQEIELPDGAEILSIQRREGRVDAVDLWALVDPSAPPVKRRFHVVGTGHKVLFRGRFLATVQIHHGQLVFHVFESTQLPVPASAQTGSETAA